MVRKIILECRLAVGDIVMMTGVVRDLHFAYPCRFLVDVRTTYPDLWRHNPLLVPLREDDPEVEVIDCDALSDELSVHAPMHCVQAFAGGLARRLGVPFFQTLVGGHVPLGGDERRRGCPVSAMVGRRVPYWIVVAGHKPDCPTKGWESSRYQEVVNAFRDRVLFVQVGAAAHGHPRLDGVVDLRGRTTLRELVRVVHHAEGVLCPITSLMHFAAAVETPPGRPRHRPCVVVAGGREAPHWAAYPHHQFVHTVGALPCCEGNGCWRSLVLPSPSMRPPPAEADLCQDVVDDGLPRCMDLITPSMVAAHLERYLATGQASILRPAEAAAVRPWLTRPEGGESGRADRAAGRRLRASRRAPMTICVLTYGDHRHQVERCLESIRRRCPRGRYRLVVGGNAVTADGQDYLRAAYREGFIDRLHLSPVNLNKSPMMRRMFRGLESEFVWWFDDDVEVIDSGALDLRLFLARQAGPSTAVWGELFRCDFDEWQERGLDVRAWIRRASWYRGRPMGLDGWQFPMGSNWVGRVSALRDLDWPDRRLVITGDDVLLGEAVRQQGWRMEDIGWLGIRRWPQRSRGPDREAIMRQQFATDDALRDLLSG